MRYYYTLGGMPYISGECDTRDSKRIARAYGRECMILTKHGHAVSHARWDGVNEYNVSFEIRPFSESEWKEMVDHFKSWY